MSLCAIHTRVAGLAELTGRAKKMRAAVADALKRPPAITPHALQPRYGRIAGVIGHSAYAALCTATCKARVRMFRAAGGVKAKGARQDACARVLRHRCQTQAEDREKHGERGDRHRSRPAHRKRSTVILSHSECESERKTRKGRRREGEESKERDSCDVSK